MKHTPLYEKHIQTASKVINLKGVARAVEYSGHIEEHHATRNGVTLCDVSHMGELEIKGKDALALVQKIITNDAEKISNNQALYTAMCNENGCVIDDLTCFRLGEQHFLWVVNVTKTEEDFQWVIKHAQGMDVTVNNISCETALMALQGPNSREVLQKISKADLSNLKYFWFVETIISTKTMEIPCIISRTGYTGELGYEIFVSKELAPLVWDELLFVGRPLGIIPHGVAARESLRTEVGYLLNGNDMDNQTNPFEAGIGWVVKFSKDFIGKDALLRISTNGISRKLVGFEIKGPETVRHGYQIYNTNGTCIGHVTSGPLSSNLAGRNLGLGYVSIEYSEIGTEIVIDIKGRKCPAVIVPYPFRRIRVKDNPSINTYSPFDLTYSHNHLWLHQDDHNIFTLGLTDFIQRDLGDILYIDLPKVGDTIESGKTLGWLDAYQKTWEIISPISGEVIEVNTSFQENPQQINKYPYIVSGLIKVRASESAENNVLVKYGDYMNQIRELQQYKNWAEEKRVF